MCVLLNKLGRGVLEKRMMCQDVETKKLLTIEEYAFHQFKKKSKAEKIYKSNGFEIFSNGKGTLLIGENVVSVPKHPESGNLLNKALPFKKHFEMEQDGKQYVVLIFQLPGGSTVLIVCIDSPEQFQWTHNNVMLSTFTTPTVDEEGVTLYQAQREATTKIKFPK